MKIKKIGGKLLTHSADLTLLDKILDSEINNNSFLLIISAFSKTTQSLKNIAYLAESNSMPKAISLLGNIKRYHLDFIAFIQNNNLLLTKFTELFDKLETYIHGINLTRELSSRTLDIVLSFGEEFALLILEAYLNSKSLNCKLVNARSVIKTDSNFGQAKPDIDISSNLIKQSFKEENNIIYITQGFVASDQKGNTTTMGMESSNLTAAIFAYALNTKVLEIYTDVPGILTADPQMCPDAKNIAELSFEDAKLLSENGLKLIYPEMVDLLRNSDISIKYLSALDNNQQSTIISRKSKRLKDSVIISHNQLYMLKTAKNISKAISDTLANSSYYFSSSQFNYLLSKNLLSIKTLSNKLNISYSDNIASITILNINEENLPEVFSKCISYPVEHISIEKASHSIIIIINENYRKKLVKELFNIIYK